MRQGKKHSTEVIVNLLRQVEVDLANSKILQQACKKGEIVELTYYCGQLKVDQARGLKELEQENAKLKRLVSELSLDKLVLKCFPALQGWYVFRCIVTLICLPVGRTHCAWGGHFVACIPVSLMQATMVLPLVGK
jgi:putative transposase